MTWSALLIASALFGAQAVEPQHQPDLTGTWATPFRVHRSGYPLASGATPWVPISAGDVRAYPIPTLDQLSAIADRSVAEHHGVPIFGKPLPPALPYTAAGKIAQAAIDPKVSEAREVGCFPTNMIDRVGGSPIRIVQNPKAIAILAEGGVPGRTIFTDGRVATDPVPQWNGMSVGHWANGTLTVTTTAVRGETFGFMPKYPMDENARVTEEYTLSRDGNALDLMITLEDPTLYTEPMKRVVHMTRAEDVMVTDYTCIEGKDDMIEMTTKPVGGEATSGARAVPGSGR